MKQGFCKLCNEYKYLAKESHILPKFCYKHLKSANNKFTHFRSNEKSPISNRPNVEYEGNIFCLDCENRLLGGLDDYGSKIINNNGFNKKLKFEIHETPENSFFVLKDSSGYDYKKFKLFLLSILWRAGISSRTAFAGVDLDSIVKADLKKMILNNDPGEEYEYPCGILLPPTLALLRGTKNFNPHITGFVIAPVPMVMNDVPAYQFIIMGTQYIFYINKNFRKDLLISTQKNQLFMLVNDTEDHAHLIYHRLIRPLKMAGYKK